MRSIYERVLGSDFARLHPEIQRRFGFSSADKVAAIGTGVMEEIWHGPIYTLPFLYVGSWRSIMFPESGRNIPFQMIHLGERRSHGFEPFRRKDRADSMPTWSTASSVDESWIISVLISIWPWTSISR